MERSIVLVKPDGLQRGLVGEIIHRFERKGLKLVAIKMISLTDAILDEWYVHHADKPFFQNLKSYMMKTPVIAMLWEGIEAAATIRMMIGITKGRAAQPGSVRGDFSMSQQYNLIHASESSEMADKEQKLVFSDQEIFSWDKFDLEQIYSDEELQ